MVNIHCSLQFFDWQFCHRVTLVGLGPKKLVLSHQNNTSHPVSSAEDAIHYVTVGMVEWELLKRHTYTFHKFPLGNIVLRLQAYLVA